jgi:hypothetical protein
VERGALQETGTMLGTLLRRALAERLAVQAARRVEALGLDGRRTGGEGGASGDADGIDRGGVGPDAVGREGDPQ